MTHGLVGFLTRVCETRAASARSDDELLRDFTESRSEEAFAELVRRFSPMVWKVCLRAIGQYQLAEDAFQAVFLVLVRRADSIRPASALAGWLHRVAVHTSLRARAMADRQKKNLAHFASAPEVAGPTPAEPVDAETLRMLDEEIARLPERLRSAVVLCELEGVGRREAARRLEIAEGTLSSRLATARKQLAARLSGRGVVLGAAGLSAMVANEVAHAAPPVVSQASETVSQLVQGVIRTMFLNKLKSVSVAIATLAAFGIGLASLPSEAGETRADRTVKLVRAPAPKVIQEGRIVLTIFDQVAGSRALILRPDGTVVAEFPYGGQGQQMIYPALSPDGKRLAVAIALPVEKWNKKCGFVPTTVAIFDIAKPEKPDLEFADVVAPRMVWAPSSRSLYLTEYDPKKVDEEVKVSKIVPMIVSSYDFETKQKRRIDRLDGHRMFDLSADGVTALTTQVRSLQPKEFETSAYRTVLATGKSEEVSQKVSGTIRLSPDGKTALLVKPPRPAAPNLIVVDLVNKTETELKFQDHTGSVSEAILSPDGTKMLVSRRRVLAGPQPRVPGMPIAPLRAAADHWVTSKQKSPFTKRTAPNRRPSTR